METLKAPVEVKISGDGAPYTRSSSFILLSFSFPQLQEKLSSHGISAISPTMKYKLTCTLYAIQVFILLQPLKE